ncbi:hypothetical protein CE91St36_03310 [Christensenellaceae bacterium]|nr:hypothetical protein CE91St36_03310 [Christensenellaceae bacterium]BDF60182.1 hypothetical protein CE91St37_03320 [Christensenellaceae bacterium]
MAVNWEDIFNQKWAEGQSGYEEQKKAYEDAHRGEQAAIDAQLKASTDKIAQTRDEALRQAYISKRQNEKTMPSLLAANGMTGGANETSVASLLRNYQNARNAANNSYASSEKDLRTNYDTNTATLGSRYANLLAQLQQKRRDDAIAQAQFAYNAQVEKEKQEEEKRRWEAEMAFRKQQIGGSSSGGGYSSGSGGGGGYTNPNTTNAGTKGYGGYTSPYKPTSKYDKSYADSVYGNKWR